MTSPFGRRWRRMKRSRPGDDRALPGRYGRRRATEGADMAGEWSTIERDETSIEVRRWEPAGTPRGILQIVHGAAEHCARYDRAAAALTDAGFAVISHDQRGHGRTADRHGWLEAV